MIYGLFIMAAVSFLLIFGGTRIRIDEKIYIVYSCKVLALIMFGIAGVIYFAPVKELAVFNLFALLPIFMILEYS